MISKGKRKHIQRLIALHLWNQLPKEEQTRRMEIHVQRLIRSVACAYNVPVRMLCGLPMSEVEMVQ